MGIQVSIGATGYTHQRDFLHPCPFINFLISHVSLLRWHGAYRQNNPYDAPLPALKAVNIVGQRQNLIVELSECENTDCISTGVIFFGFKLF